MHYRKTLNTRSLEHFLNGCSRQTDSSKQDEMERKCTSESTTGPWVHQISQVPPPLEISSSDSCSKSHWRLKLLFLLCGQWLDLVQDSVATGMLHSQSKVILRKHILPMKLLSMFLIFRIWRWFKQSIQGTRLCCSHISVSAFCSTEIFNFM